MSQTAACIARSIHDALLEEVQTTPKPGLVDLYSNGAHQDLSVELFRTSAKALEPTFRSIVALALSWDREPEKLFTPVRELGMDGEIAMFAATGGVNTHKGALFSLGVLAAATGYAIRHRIPLEPQRLCLLAARITAPTLTAELGQMAQRLPSTHGERLFRARGHRGIRGEVMDGFPTLRTHILPLLPPAGTPLSESDRIHLLLVLMHNLEDTNVLFRGGEEALAFVREHAGRMLALEPESGATTFERRLKSLDRLFIEKNLSSGGAADLLAATLYLHDIAGHRDITAQEGVA
jgi:triphosphoribosyl-dephospho-CoA synthase CitG